MLAKEISFQHIRHHLGDDNPIPVLVFHRRPALPDLLSAISQHKSESCGVGIVLTRNEDRWFGRILELIDDVYFWTSPSQELKFNAISDFTLNPKQFIFIDNSKAFDAPATYSPAPSLQFIKIGGSLLLAGDIVRYDYINSLIQALASSQNTNFAIFLGSGPYARKLAARLELNSLPDTLALSVARDALDEYEFSMRTLGNEVASICRRNGLAAVHIPISNIISFTDGQLVPCDPTFIVNVLKTGGIPLITGGKLSTGKDIVYIPSVEHAAVAAAKSIVPTAVIILTKTGGVLNNNGEIYPVLTTRTAPPDLSLGARTPSIFDSIPLYRSLASSSIRVFVMDGQNPINVRHAFRLGQHSGTEICSYFAGSLPVPTVSYERLQSHQELLSDKERVTAFADAIKVTVKPSDTVLDFGTGTGIWAWLAAHCGAKKVYAIENEEILNVAKELTAPLAHKICLGDSVPEDLPEKSIDVLISEVIGTFGVQTRSLRPLLEVRDKFLSPRGVMIPKRLILFMAPAWSPSCARRISFWNQFFMGMQTDFARRLSASQIYLTVISPNCVLGKPVKVAEYDLKTCKNFGFEWKGQFKVRDRTEEGVIQINGLAAWFKLVLTDEIVIDTSPSSMLTTWYHAFFPFDEVVFPVRQKSFASKVSCRYTSKGIGWKWYARINTYNGRKFIEHSCFCGEGKSKGLLKGRPYPWFGWEVVKNRSVNA